jgi:hypothetical protein
LILDTKTRDELEVCISCDHGIELAKLCPFYNIMHNSKCESRNQSIAKLKMLSVYAGAYS